MHRLFVPKYTVLSTQQHVYQLPDLIPFASLRHAKNVNMNASHGSYSVILVDVFQK